MPSATISQEMPCSSKAVFDLLHDYSRRLEWDTLLREARLTRGHAEAAKGATSLCVGKPLFGLIGIETRYVTFTPDTIAAVEMINRPPFFQRFAASIRHVDIDGGSKVIYKLRFTARPRFLRWILDPVMMLALQYETRKRMRALADFLLTQKAGQDAATHGSSASSLHPRSHVRGSVDSSC